MTMEPEGFEPSSSRALDAGFMPSRQPTEPAAGAIADLMLRPRVSGDGGSRTRSSSVQARRSAVRASSPGAPRRATRSSGGAHRRSNHQCYPLHLGLDQCVARGEGSGDAVPAVPDEECISDADETHGRGNQSLLEPAAVALDLRRADGAATTLADPDLGERGPDRRRAALVSVHGGPPFGSSVAAIPQVRVRVRTGGVEPPQREGHRVTAC